MIVLNTQGVVLKSIKYNENDLILTIYTRMYGKVAAIAKGAQRAKSRHLPTSQLFSYNNYTLKKQKGLFQVYQSDSIKSFYNISTDFDSFSYSTFILKLVEMNTDEGQVNNDVFGLLVQTLFLYSEAYENRLFLLDIFLLKFIDFMGYKPQVSRCVSCGKTNYKYAVFSIEDGGIVCDSCENPNNFYIKIDQTTISLMQYILNNDIIVCSKAQVSNVLVNELFYLLKKYLVNYFEKIDFKSLEMLKNLK
ncbi:DNA recombination protein RecO [Peptostreptococcus russellii]|uniref:DNA repair protein RecO n=1 Tax=Peptostreptococcus russellii TaxID=215200 RepID=A0A2P7Q1W8_9FIRM|nr:DNA repair protein RecO [Peptostreptococcus russellii]PSJ31940.1 DNA recombination protein RecO [Peptostreptococcus russellii]